MVIDKIKKRIEYKEEMPEAKEENSSLETRNARHSDIPIGKWVKCEACKQILYKDDVHKNNSVCPNCGHHFRLSSRRRIAGIIDEGTFEEFAIHIKTDNPLDMPEYVKKLETLKEKTGLEEAVKCGIGEISGQKTVICVMDSNFMMGSMGKVVGEMITYSVEKAIELNMPIIVFCASGGARMQEGIVSLMQMAKTSAAIAKLNKTGNLYISVLTDPTYGGVTASFAMLGDIILAEPKAMIGFAGPRVIKQTIGQELPEGFQTAEFLLEHGFIDKVVDRKDMKECISSLIKAHQKQEVKYRKEEAITEVIAKKKKELSPIEKVKIARDSSRPTSLDYIECIFDKFIELHGDRYFKDDSSIVCGIGSINGKSYTVIGEQKGRSTKENIERNFGMPNPEAYRKALRFMKQAEKFNRPIITFIDTKGAYPGLGAEERGQGEAIARNLMEMSNLKVPIICIVIGEGSSGGALAIGVGDRILMLENAIYSILSPEGYASILWKDSSRANEAAEKMKLTAKDLYDLHIIDEILEEPNGNASTNIQQMACKIKDRILKLTEELEKLDDATLVEKRYEKYRKM